MVPFPQDSVGAHLGRYEVVRKLATGGMAEIFLARMRGAAGFEKLCVLKRIPPSVAADTRLVEMFLDEARLSATLRHPNIADVFDLGTDAGSYFFAMEYIHGQDARMVRLQAHTLERPIPLEIGIAIIHGTASALAYAHDKVGPDGPLGVVHRDVSPGNILISYDGAVKLVDFGIARATTRSHVTKSGKLKGKIPYMSPEQCRGQPLDRRSDLFSLGIVLYELTVGCRPFSGTSEFGIMEHIVNRAPRLPSSLIPGYPAGLEAIVMKLLSRDRTHRYQTADELGRDLEAMTAAHRLSITTLTLGKYIRSLFPGEIAAWERAAQYGTSLAQYVADTAATPVVRPNLETPAYGLVVARHQAEPSVHTEATRGYPLDGPPLDHEDDDQEETSDHARAPFRGESYEVVERKLGIVDDVLDRSPRPAHVPSRDFSIDDPTHQARPSDIGMALASVNERTIADLACRFDPIEGYRAEVEAELDVITVPNETPPDRAARRFVALLARAQEALQRREHDNAVVVVDLALEDPDVLPDVIERNTDMITAIFEAYLGDRVGSPALARQLEDMASLPLGPHAAFLLSRIDGMVSIDDLLDVSGMPRQDACRHLCQLYLLGVLQ